MRIKLTQPFGRTSPADGFDVLQMKKALNRLGYYQPYDQVGITDIPDRAVFDALKEFQLDQGMTGTGEAKPGDDTEAMLNREIVKPQQGKYIWRIVEDGKARPAHAQYNRRARNWSDAPDPGEDFNCRCWAEPYKTVDDIYDPPIEPVYPELLLLPLLRVTRLYIVWKEWFSNPHTEWTLGRFKSEIRWGNQLRNRDWTPEQITETIKYGKRYPAPNKVNSGNTATRYEYKDRFVVRDDQTNEILQISGNKNFKPNIEGN